MRDGAKAVKIGKRKPEEDLMKELRGEEEEAKS